MANQILVPQLGESVIEATVGEWLKKEGETVQVGDVVVELETDKVDVEVGAPAAGVLTNISQQTGADVKVGDVLGVIEANGAGAAGKESVEREKPERTEARQEAKEKEAAESEPPPARAATADASDSRPVTPVARRLAEAEGIDLAEVSGSGPGGRVTKQDVAQHVGVQHMGEKSAAAAAQEAEQPPAAPTPAPKPESKAMPPTTMPSPPPWFTEQRTDSREERVRMSRRRRTIAQRLVEAQQTAAMLTTFNEIDMSAVVDIRKRRQEAFVARHGIKLGFTSFFVKASVGALKAFPRLNAEIQGDEMVLKHYYDIGVAVGAEEGLVVPVIRDADKKSFAQIEQEVKDLAAKAGDGTLSLEDLRGGTFTITNGGVFGSMLSTPILNPPQVGILGLHNIQERPVVRNGEVVIRPIMYVALTYDHRIVDGREAVQFLVRVKELVEDPESLLLEG
jgi:2-oxoglutarate dehydrogenase E2 component (dihydrolipoamide succinyltransferase)